MRYRYMQSAKDQT